MRIRNLLVVAVLLASVPATARAEDTIAGLGGDTATATTITETATLTLASPMAVASSLDLVERTRVLTLINRRAGKVTASTKSGMAAVDTDGSTLWTARGNRSLMPASTMKVITAVVALKVLGPNWRPLTSVTYDSSSRTLALVGGGDALLSSAQLATLARSTVDSLTGAEARPLRLVVDDSLFPAPSIQPGVHSGQLPSEERPVRALVVDRRKVRDSALDAGRRFRDLLAGAGMTVQFRGRAMSTGTQIAGVRGLNLRTSLRSMLVYSDNDIAEMTFRLSALGSGKQATWADARATAYATLTALDVPVSRLRIIDGSGLSRNNRLTPYALAEVLSIAQQTPRADVLPALLPKAGIEGTLRRRYAAAPASCVYGALQAKTGSLHDVIALAGYAPVAEGAARPFAILINDVGNSAYARNRTRAQIDNLAASFSGC